MVMSSGRLAIVVWSVSRVRVFFFFLNLRKKVSSLGYKWNGSKGYYFLNEMKMKMAVKEDALFQSIYLLSFSQRPIVLKKKTLCCLSSSHASSSDIKKKILAFFSPKKKRKERKRKRKIRVLVVKIKRGTSSLIVVIKTKEESTINS